MLCTYYIGFLTVTLSNQTKIQSKQKKTYAKKTLIRIVIFSECRLLGTSITYERKNNIHRNTTLEH